MSLIPLVSFPWPSLYPTLSVAHLSVFLSVFLALNWRLFSVLHLILNFVPIFIFRSSSPTSLLPLSHFVDLFATSKVRFIFYYFSCLSDMFKVILLLCDPFAFLETTWNLFREFDVLDIATSTMENRVCEWWHNTSFIQKRSYFSSPFALFRNFY